MLVTKNKLTGVKIMNKQEKEELDEIEKILNKEKGALSSEDVQFLCKKIIGDISMLMVSCQEGMGFLKVLLCKSNKCGEEK